MEYWGHWGLHHQKFYPSDPFLYQSQKPLYEALCEVLLNNRVHKGVTELSQRPLCILCRHKYYNSFTFISFPNKKIFPLYNILYILIFPSSDVMLLFTKWE